MILNKSNKAKYLPEYLKIKDKILKEKFEKEYAELINEKVK